MINKKEILNFHSRRKIFNTIKENPGLHYTEIARVLNIPKSTLKHHLRYLTNSDIIVAKKEGRYIRYYIYQTVGNKAKKYLHFLRQETPCNILMILFFEFACSRTELSQLLEKHPTTIEYHLKKLLQADLIKTVEVDNIGIRPFKNNKHINRKPLPNEKIYCLVDTHSLYNVLISNQDSLKKNNLAVYLILGPLSYCYINDTLPDIINTEKTAVDRIVEIVTDLFPPPIIL